MKNRISLILRVIFTFIILYVIISRIDLRKILETYKDLNFMYFIISVFFYYIAFLLLSIRWKVLLLQYSDKFNIWEIFKVYLLGMLVNLISPATLGVDILRGYLISQKIERGKTFSFASVFVDRLIGLIGIFTFVPVSILILKNIPNPINLFLFFIITSIAVIAGIYISWTGIFERGLKRISNIIPFPKVREKFLSFYLSYKTYRSFPSKLLKGYILTLLLQSSFSTQAFFCAKALNIHELPFFIFIFLIPLINALNFVPLTISGIGIREGGFYFLFSFFILPEKAVSISILYFISGIVGNLPFITYLFKKPLK